MEHLEKMKIKILSTEESLYYEYEIDIKKSVINYKDC